ncbi:MULTISPECIES: ABC transporter permease [Bacillaceae]|uniref:Ribose transport system permease protein n=1 Tax=Peribacillus huizhouensis TaxID=1501239 RepID=A0ABR6CPH3_9BACI|nr:MULTISPECIES: ABC transporter permease [Bacillaceae]MBA9026475.1 ribose transport system permease protein [Peribacillus huizhouensis]
MANMELGYDKNLPKEKKNKKLNFKQFLIDNNTYIILVLLIIISSMLTDTFLTSMNLRNIALQQAAPILVAIGMLFVIVAGGIDLSVGSVMAVGATVSAILISDMGMNYLPAMFLAVVIGIIFGLFTGILVAYAGMQGFVASLATMTIARGVSFVITGGRPVKLESGTLDTIVSKEFFYPIILIAIVLIVVFAFVQKYTSWGRIAIAIGSNPTAVQLAGIRTKRYIMSTYAVSAALAALAGVFIAARSSTGSATVGMGQELDAIAACVIGGASLAGGKGFVVKAVAGGLILGLIGNIMNLMAVPSYPQDIIKGFIIIAAVLLGILTNKSEKTV